MDFKTLDVSRQKTHYAYRSKSNFLFIPGVAVTESVDVYEGYKATELGVIPEEWDVVNVGETIQKTSTLNPNKNPNYEFDYIDVSSVSSDTLTIVNTTHCIANSCPSRARKIVEENDVIFATVRPSLRRVSQVPKKMNNLICSTAFCVLRPNPKKIDPSFLFYAVSYGDFVDRVSEHQRGVAYPAITDKEILEESIPLPPLPEQHAIATTLRTVQEAKENTDAVIAATKALKAAMMKHLFTYGPVPPEEADKVALKETEIGYMAEGWEILKLEDIVSVKITDGVHKTPKYTDTGVPFISAINMANDTLNFLNCKCISFEAHEKLIQRCHPELNDILLCKVGATIGKVAKIEVTFPLSIFVQVALIKPDLLKINPDFLKYSLISKNGQSQILTNASQSTMPFIGTNKIGKILIPYPGIQIQEKIGKILFTIDQKLAAEQSRKEVLDTLFTSLLHDLMTAKIRVNKIAV